ncbi:PA2928 family protein [Actinosynnema sp. NPDC023587]|uniref:PA2928 family protein n=1 Tax=Actinosynnema sp. NPDC023587 TaxID=3154695 RepID=UPI00340B9152
MRIPQPDPVYGTPPQYYPALPYGTPPRRFRRGPVIALIPLVLFACLFFGGSYLVAPEPDVEARGVMGFAAVDGREVVLVPYTRHGPRGMFQLLFQDMFQVRLAARDVTTGELVWDTQLSDELLWQADVLASGERYTYVATDAGLVVLDLADGATIAGGPDVEGLGPAYIAAPWAYRFDAGNRRVVAMGGDGRVSTIDLDSVTAVPADPPTAAAWAGQLAERGAADPRTGTRSQAEYAGGQVELVARADGGPGHTLVKVAPDGDRTPVGDAVFQHGGLVVAGTAAAGAGSEQVLVVHARGVNDPAKQLSAVSLTTGKVTGSTSVDTGTFTAAATSTNGVTAVGVGPVVAALTPDGQLTAVPIGSADFFGTPS